MVIRSPPTSPTQAGDRVAKAPFYQRGSSTRPNNNVPASPILSYQEAIEVEHVPVSPNRSKLGNKISKRINKRIQNNKMMRNNNNNDTDKSSNEGETSSSQNSTTDISTTTTTTSSSNEKLVLETNHDYEVYDEHDNLMGCIEVEAMDNDEDDEDEYNDNSTGVTISKITFRPSNNFMVNESVRRNIGSSGNSNNNNTDNGDGNQDYGLMDTVLDTFIGQCQDMQACAAFYGEDVDKSKPRKSILKKTTDGKNGNDADVNNHNSSDNREISRHNRGVSFNNLQIREYNVTLGDHPNAKSGPPIQLDWTTASKDDNIIDLDDYEKSRQKANPRRTRRKLKLSFRERERILMNECGFTKNELVDAWTQSLMVRQQRHETIHRSPMTEKFDEVWESANRKFWRLLQYETI